MHLHQAASHLADFHAWLLPCARAAGVLAVIFVTCFLLYVLGRLRLSPIVRLILLFLFVAFAIACAFAVCTYSPLVVAKGALIICLWAGGVFCLFLLCVLPQIDSALTSLQRECELATQLCFMQGEMTRAQLEALNERLQQAGQPQEREITESVLRSLSPLVMLYFRKEKSIIKWSLAAANLGRGIIDRLFKH